jgi:hypothetical protein
MSAAQQSTNQHQPSQNFFPTTQSGLIELNETVSRLASYKGVELVQILNRNGDIITESNTISGISAATSSNNTASGSVDQASGTTVTGASSSTGIIDNGSNGGTQVLATVGIISMNRRTSKQY